MAESIDLSIIIVSYNTKKLTLSCIDSIYATTSGLDFLYEIIVVDNNSNDGTIEEIYNKYPRVVIIESKTNIGFGRANNIGINAAHGHHVLLLNSDIVVLGDALKNIYTFSVSHPRTFVGGKLLNSDRSEQTSCGYFFSLPVVFMSLFLFGDRLKLTRFSPQKIRKIDWVSGACILVERSILLNDLLFDENIFMYMEEIDLLYRRGS
jgi:GT2 family glycosyltransferase